MEGIMMKGGEDYAIAVRREDGTVSLSKHTHTSVRKKHKLLRLPIIRGIVGFVESMILNFKTLSQSAEQLGIDESEPETKFDKWLNDHLGEKLMAVVMAISMVLGVVLAIGLFFLLPTYVTKGIEWLIGGENKLGVFKNVIEGVLKIVIFVAYLLLVSLMKEIRRTFEYHGAEHKSIFCYEAGEELTVENVKKYRRFHPRCGTSFIFVILIISILINSLPFIPWDNALLRMLFKMLVLPLTVGIGFEFIMFAGKHDNVITRILSAPGLWMQRITTREPDDSQIEVAIIALKTALPSEFPDYRYVDPHDVLPAEEAAADEAADDEASAEEAFRAEAPADEASAEETSAAKGSAEA